MTAHILRFPLAQEPIRLAMPQVHPGWCWPLIVALVLNFAVVIAVAMIAWRSL